MRIFIDESGNFSGASNISAVGALIIPDQHFKGFEKLYGRLRRNLPKEKCEVKGRLLQEEDIRGVCDVLRKVGCLFEVVAVDTAFHNEKDVKRHMLGQADGLTKHLTADHQKGFVDEIWKLRRQLETMSPQLYVQSCAMIELVYNTLNHANLYHSFRLWKELGEYHWIIGAKDRDKVTPWEDWWSKVLAPLIESKSFREPFIAVREGNYKAHERFRSAPDDYKAQFYKADGQTNLFELRPILKEDFRFSWAVEYGLEAADILVNVVRRSLAGNFRREGWLPVRELMVHRNQHYIQLVALGPDNGTSPNVGYHSVMRDFSTGGREMLPPGHQ